MARTVPLRDEYSMFNEPFREENVRVITCRYCDAEVELTNGWLNTCPECGAEYNGWGQALAPREEWGWETGELF